jgi:proteic killer suppression protein
MILSFADDATADLWNGINSARVRRIPVDIRTRVLDRLTALDVAARIDDLRVPPSNRLEKLEGDLARLWSIRVNKQRRITFRWDDGAAGPSEVWLRDYH